MPKFAANLSMLFTEVEFLDRFAAAARAGFQGVEYLFPYDYPAETLKARLDDNGLTQVLFNLPAGDWAAGERGIACHPDRVEEFRDGVERAIAHVQIADTPGLHEPGTGEIHYPFLFAHLDRLGYDGWVGAEYKPAGRTEEGLGWLDAVRN